MLVEKQYDNPSNNSSVSKQTALAYSEKDKENSCVKHCVSCCILNSGKPATTLQNDVVSRQNNNFFIDHYNDIEEQEEEEAPSFITSSYTDNKKQTSILKYFVPVTKSPIKCNPKNNTVNPKFLRGNRLSSLPGTISVFGVKPEQNSYPENKNCESNSSSRKRKYSSLRNRFSGTRLVPPLSLMDNLINQKKHKHIPPSMKKCFVILTRIDDCKRHFIGWDFSDEKLFRGFELSAITNAQEKINSYKTFLNKFSPYATPGKTFTRHF